MLCRWKAVVASLSVLLTMMLAPAAPSAEDAGPIRLHPDNPHYFSWRGEPTILVTSGEHYGAVLNLDFDYRTYVKTLAADGLNHTRVFSGTYREVASSFGITDNPLAPKPGRYACPWARSDEPGYAHGGNKFDLTRFDPAYFERLKDFMRAADEAGVVVEYTLFCPLYREELWDVSPMNVKNNVNGVGDCPSNESLTLKHPALVDLQLVFVRHAVKELNAFDNLYFEVCNEPYFGGVAMDWQQRVVDLIHETEKPLPKKHLVSLNIANGRKKVDAAIPGVSILNFHYCIPPDVVAMNYGLDVVIGENETGFRGKHDLLYRTEAWDFLLAGGALYNNLDYSFTPGREEGQFLDYKSPGGGSPALRKQLGILKRFLEGFDFLRMRPDASIVETEGEAWAAYALVEPGRQYAIYLHTALPRKPKSIADHERKDAVATLSVELPRGAYTAQWIDTKTGQVAATSEFRHDGGTHTLQTPRFTNDIALKIVRSRGR